MRTLATTILLLALASFGELAGQSASPYIPISHWSMPFLEQLITAGVIRDPTPLTRPFKQSEILAELDRVDTTRLAPPVRETVRRISAEFAPAAAFRVPSYRFEIALGAEAASYTFRDPLELNRDSVGT